MSVQGWAHKAEACFAPGPTQLDISVQQQRQRQQSSSPPAPADPRTKQQQQQPLEGEAFSVWTVLAPFRRSGSQARSSYVATLSHHMMYHLVVGFAGALVYTPPSLMQGLLGDGQVAAWVQEGRLLLLLWDKFSTYQEVDTDSNQVQEPV